ncbi:MAG: hypothetical protein VX641_02240 [Planctomycetota bacterium]|nr:hypothetical protein [Planctomycetota bacterium]
MIRPCLLPIVIAAASTAANAQSLEFTIDQQGSLIDRSLAVQVPFAGSLIGNYDAETNPEGTRTLPGIFGGSGNNPIGYSATNDISGSSSSTPTGSFVLDVDFDAGTVEITSFSVDVLGGGSDVLSANLGFLYETFRTVNPGGFFLGGFEIPIPLGDIALDTWTLEQSGPSDLVLGFAPENPGLYGISGTIPLTNTISFTLFEEVITPEPFLLPFPIDGTLVETESGFEFQVVSSTTFDNPIPADGFEFTDLAFPLPTLGGDTANLLLSGIASEGNASGTWAINLIASGVEIDTCQGTPDLNDDGRINGQDLSTLLATWGEPNGAGDINCDGTVSGPDLAELLANWNP